MSTFPQIDNHSWSCRTSILEGATFHKMILQSSFEVILARQSSHFPTWASSSRTSGSRCIFHTLLRRRSWRKVRLCRFCMLIHIVSETATVSKRTLPVSFPMPTISWTSLFTPFLASKFFICKFCSILLFTIVFNL